jgi:hypothetical protein
MKGMLYHGLTGVHRNPVLLTSSLTGVVSAVYIGTSSTEEVGGPSSSHHQAHRVNELPPR